MHNRGAVAARCDLRVPAALRSCVDAVPDYLFVQAGESATFAIKFEPKEDTAETCARYFEERGNGDADEPRSAAGEEGEASTTSARHLSAPMRVTTPAGAVRFVRASASLTRADLAVRYFGSDRGDALDFGAVCVGETALRRVAVTNRGSLMQQFGVTGLPPGVSVKPAAFGEILGGETIELVVGYAPETVGEKGFAIVVKALLGAYERARSSAPRARSSRR